MMDETLDVLILGGDRTVAQLVVDFASRAFLNVVGVVDVNDDSPAAMTALSAGIPFADHVSDLAPLIPEPDLIIDMAQWPDARREILDAYPDAAGGQPTVIHNATAKLMLGLAADTSVPLLPKLAGHTRIGL